MPPSRMRRGCAAAGRSQARKAARAARTSGASGGRRRAGAGMALTHVSATQPARRLRDPKATFTSSQPPRPCAALFSHVECYRAGWETSVIVRAGKRECNSIRVCDCQLLGTPPTFRSRGASRAAGPRRDCAIILGSEQAGAHHRADIKCTYLCRMPGVYFMKQAPRMVARTATSRYMKYRRINDPLPL